MLLVPVEMDHRQKQSLGYCSGASVSKVEIGICNPWGQSCEFHNVSDKDFGKAHAALRPHSPQSKAGFLPNDLHPNLVRQAPVKSRADFPAKRTTTVIFMKKRPLLVQGKLTTDQGGQDYGRIGNSWSDKR